ncbi:MAG: AAA family ATPase [Spirulina sp.]
MNGLNLKIPRYEVSECFHESDRTLVYRGRRQDDGKPVVIKLMRNEYPSFNELVQFRNQYIIAKNLDLDGIVKPYALERHENRYALIMEDFGGVSLTDYRREMLSFSLAQFLAIAIQLAEILARLHQNRVIHKDIKPANILIHPQTKQVKLIDFSISTLLPKETQTLQSPKGLEGTLAYLSPEQTGRMNRGIDYRSDFYSLGITFYELLTGNLPFTHEDPLQLIHAHIAREASPANTWIGLEGKFCPQTLANIVAKLMAKNAEDRYQSASGLKSDVEKCLVQWQETGEIEEFELGERDRCDRFLIPEKLYGREKEVQTLLDAFHRVASSQSPPAPNPPQPPTPPQPPNPPQPPLVRGERGERGEKKGGAGRVEMVLVAGYSGVGKTAVVNEVHKPIVEKRGYFIKGKYDQFQRNIPFSGFVQAFRDLMGQFLGESDRQLQQWKETFLSTLGDNGQVIIDTIPELEKIIGEQPPVPELEGMAAQNRFNLLFGKFVGAIAAREHPLTIFLDDLQWADYASLNLLKLLMGEAKIEHLLVLGAYRDNEVFPAHPLMLTEDELQEKGANLQTLTLTPLDEVNINRLVADTLLCSQKIAAPLSELVYQKTQGNPFFTTQFLQGLHEDGWIAFIPPSPLNPPLVRGEVRGDGGWQCDLTKVRQLALTDNVVEFMVGRLQKLPEATRGMLKLAACIGNQFDSATLAVACEGSQEQVATDLWRALQEGFVIPESEIYKFFQADEGEQKAVDPSDAARYRFLHDRVQQAAYALIPEEGKAIAHYRIGRLLQQKIPPEAKEERIFAIVGQLNYGTTLMTEQKERDELAELNLIACRKARNSTAYQAGRDYANAALALLGEDAWERQYHLTLTFYNFATELASLCGDFADMERRMSTVLDRARTLLDRIHVYRIKIYANVSQNRLGEAITIAREVLQDLGVTFPETPEPKDIQQAILELGQLIGDRDIEDFADLPAMTDGEKIAIVRIANSIIPATYISGSALFPLVATLSVSLSIQYGNIPASAFAYANYGIIACNLLHDVDAGFKFGQLALRVISQLKAKASEPDVFMVTSAFIVHRKAHLQETLPLAQKGYARGLEVGNVEAVGYTIHGFCANAFWGSRHLSTLEQEIRAYYHVLMQVNQWTTANYCRIYWQSIVKLLGVANQPDLGAGKSRHRDPDVLPQLLQARDLLGLSVFSLHHVMLAYLFGDLETARDRALEGEQYLMASAGTINEPLFYFYDSLSALAAANGDPARRSQVLQRVENNQTRLQQDWATPAPMNHQHKVDLVEAEKCRVCGQKTEAIEWYEKAIAGAKENEFVQEEALANELTARFYLDWGKDKAAVGYMQEAYYSYARWGAKAKAEDLERRYPQLLSPILERKKLTLTSSTISREGTLASITTGSGEIFDLASLMKASRTLSEEIDLDRAIANLMRVVMENAGAETGALMLFREQILMLEAKVTYGISEAIEPIPVEICHGVPLSIINAVKRIGQPLVLDNARQDSRYAGDAYIQKYQPQSVFCAPLIVRASSPQEQRGQLRGLLYLENNRVAGAFTRDRVEILNLLCSQGAISLENARLYRQSRQATADLKQALADLQQAQLQIVQNEKMATLGNLVAGVAHEINNPVGFIGGNVGAAQEHVQDLLEILSLYQDNAALPESIAEAIEDLDPEFIREDFPKLIASMQSGCDRIRNISTSLRTFSRTDTDAKTEFNLHEGLDSTLLILKYRLKASEQRPAMEIVKNYGEIPAVKCYPGQLNQVFMNLLANAIDALDESNQGKSFAEIETHPNRITIQTELSPEKKSILIAISDNGKGMKEEVRERIFEQGFTTKAVGKGTGLGMAIARQIVEEKHGGTITCTSELGQGTTFRITLPL